MVIGGGAGAVGQIGAHGDGPNKGMMEMGAAGHQSAMQNGKSVFIKQNQFK
jgi:hypothetical protein